MIDKVTIKKFSELSGYTEAAIRTKISEGVWQENKVYVRAPDNRLLISIEGYDAWAGREFEPRGNSQSPLPLLPIKSRRGRNSSPKPLV
jgi:hypothetical protein|tara:strand:- start:168 stop:434 length:267 start_codon:yes stop_codon:yes gene_type:complete